MRNKKKNGAYYTPAFLSDFIFSHIQNQITKSDTLKILEPSVGDGMFVKSFLDSNIFINYKKVELLAIEKNGLEIIKAKNRISNNQIKGIFSHGDFLTLQQKIRKKFSLIIGNPPYIKKNLLSKKQVSICSEIHSNANLSETSIKNIWSAFLVRCTQLLTNDGVLSFVLPAELLQVKFSAELRTFLTKHFTRVEIFTFEDLLFECKGQDTIVLIAYKQHPNPGQYYTHIVDTNQLVNKDFILAQNHALVSTDVKWTHHLFAAEDLEFIYNIGKNLKNINHYSESKPGIVTAANSFFIVNREIESEYQLTEYAKPIIQKGFFVNGSVTFEKKDFIKLADAGKPTKILVFNDSDSGKFSESIKEYLELGKDLKLPLRYKCIKRKNWFVIPNISTVPQGFFFKRSHHYPKLLKNKADVLVTDSAYKIEMRDSFSIDDLVYSFYNSLTLTFAELNGRYYGGGVLELTPQEFKNLPIPNISITPQEFKVYTRKFEEKNEIADILDIHDTKILNKSLNLNIEQIERIKKIYQKLINKRFRKKE